MGTPKALLTVCGMTFAERIAHEAAAASIGDTVIVLGSEHERIQASIGTEAGRIVVNGAWQTGRLSSIIAGIDALDPARCSGALIWPVDHPLVSAITVRAMASAFSASPTRIVIPSHHGRRGHPIILPSGLFEEVRHAPGDLGLRAVVRAHADCVCVVPVDDAGILINIDTPEEYAMHCTRQK